MERVYSTLKILDYLSDFKSFSKHFVCLGHNPQSVTQDHQRDLTIEA